MSSGGDRWCWASWPDARCAATAAEPYLRLFTSWAAYNNPVLSSSPDSRTSEAAIRHLTHTVHSRCRSIARADGSAVTYSRPRSRATVAPAGALHQQQDHGAAAIAAHWCRQHSCLCGGAVKHLTNSREHSRPHARRCGDSQGSAWSEQECGKRGRCRASRGAAV